MALVAIALLVVYAGVAYLGYRLLAAVWVARGDLFAAVAWTTGLTILLGYLSYRFGTAQVLAQVEADERIDRLVERANRARSNPEFGTGRSVGVR